MTKNEIIEMFLKRANNKKNGYSDCTTNTYLGYIEKYLDYAESNGIDVLTASTAQISDDFLNDLYGDKADKTFNLVLASIHSLYEVLKNRDLIKVNPCDKIDGVAKPKSKEKMSISNEDYNALLRACKNSRDNAILTFLMNTGVRANELVNIKYEDFINYDEENGLTLTVTKGSKNRVIYLNGKVISSISEYLKDRKNADCEYLFVSNYGNKMDKSCIFRTIKTIAHRANLDEEVIDNLSAHSFRHSAITNMIDKGVNIATVATIVGHSSTTTTFNYIDKSKLDIKNAMCM